MLATVVKDIVVQIAVWLQFRFSMTSNGLVQHFKALFLCLPLHIAVIIFALVSFLANSDLMSDLDQHDEALYEWARLSLNSLFIAGVYLCVHLFPLSCIYFDS